MSRIEQALEKAINMREASKPSSNALGNKDFKKENNLPLPKFPIRDSIVELAKVDRHIVCLTEPFSPASEQYRKLRARILTETKPDFQNTIMVSSAEIGEGKSTTAINFAIALAQGFDNTVLLVDADLRKPAIHKYLGIDAVLGLSDYLSGMVELSDVLIQTGIGKLVLLPAGTPYTNPDELLSSNKMKELVQELKHRYRDRYIIFDTSPLLVSADSISVSNLVDRVLLVIQAAKTPQKTVKEAIGLLNNAPILGVVYNNVPEYMDKLRPYSSYYGSAANAEETISNNGNK